MSGEFRVVRDALLWGVAAAVPVGAIAYLARGGDGAASALIALGLVLANCFVSALVSAFAGKLSKFGAMLVSLPSFAIRMSAIAAALVLLKGRSFVDEPTFALCFGLALTAALVLQARSMRRTPWLALTFDAEATR
jgi:hypothetical protein